MDLAGPGVGVVSVRKDALLTPNDQEGVLPDPDAEEAYVTTAEMLRAEGRAEALVQLLTLKFGPLPQAVLDTVHAASTDQLQTWTARVLSATTLDEVLA